EHIPIEGWMMVESKRCDELMIDNHWMDKMIDYLSIVETNKANHAMKTDMVKLVVELRVLALNEPHLHEIHVVPSKHEADQC
ncbi:hypothetical protein Tco_0274052, partial [Tanacetum coccineum]